MGDRLISNERPVLTTDSSGGHGSEEDDYSLKSHPCASEESVVETTRPTENVEDSLFFGFT